MADFPPIVPNLAAGTSMAPEPAPLPPYELMRDRLQKGLVIPFLGAGASLLRDPRGGTGVPQPAASCRKPGS